MYLLPDTAEVGPSGRLRIGGVDVLDLVSEVGTPVFVYDEEHLRRRCRRRSQAFGAGVAYASKAFLCRAMARLVHEEGMCIDVSTGGELHVALAGRGARPTGWCCTATTSPTPSWPAALDAGVGRIVVDSFDEIDRLERLAARGARRPVPSVLIRVTPGIEAHTHEYVMTGQDDSKFGFGLASGRRRRRWPGSGTRPAGSRWSACTPTSARRSSPWSPSRRALALLAAFFLRLGPRRAVHRRRPRRPLRDRRVGPLDHASGPRRCTTRAQAAGLAADVRAHRRAGPGDRGRGRDHLLHGRHHQGAPRACGRTSASTAA